LWLSASAPCVSQTSSIGHHFFADIKELPSWSNVRRYPLLQLQTPVRVPEWSNLEQDFPTGGPRRRKRDLQFGEAYLVPDLPAGHRADGGNQFYLHNPTDCRVGSGLILFCVECRMSTHSLIYLSDCVNMLSAKGSLHTTNHYVIIWHCRTQNRS
jgi:hypothetical protein